MSELRQAWEEATAELRRAELNLRHVGFQLGFEDDPVGVVKSEAGTRRGFLLAQGWARAARDDVRTATQTLANLDDVLDEEIQART